MKGNKLKYLFYCKFCGHLLMKKEALVMFATKIKCPKCKKILSLPGDSVTKISDGKEKRVFHSLTTYLAF